MDDTAAYTGNSTKQKEKEKSWEKTISAFQFLKGWGKGNKRGWQVTKMIKILKQVKKLN